QGGKIGFILQFFLELFLNFLVVRFHIPKGLVSIPSNGVNILIGFAILNMNQNRKPFSSTPFLLFHILFHNFFHNFIQIAVITPIHVIILPFSPSNLSYTDFIKSHILPPFLDISGLLGPSPSLSREVFSFLVLSLSTSHYTFKLRKSKALFFLKFFQLIIQQFPSKHIIDIVHDSVNNLFTNSYLFPISLNIITSRKHAMLSNSDHNSVHFD